MSTTTTISVRLIESDLVKLDELRRQRPGVWSRGIETRGEVLRRLIREEARQFELRKTVVDQVEPGKTALRARKTPGVLRRRQGGGSSRG